MSVALSAADIQAYMDQQRRRRAQIAAFSTKRPKPEKHESLFDRLTPDLLNTPLGVAGRAIDQIADTVIHTPQGLYQLGKGIASDEMNMITSGNPLEMLAAAIPGGTLAYGDNTQAFAKGMATSMYEDFRHPLRNPGYLLMDIASLASGGAGLTARTARAARALEASRGFSTAGSRMLGRLGSDAVRSGAGVSDLGSVSDVLRGSPFGTMGAVPDSFRPGAWREAARGLTSKRREKARLYEKGRAADLAEENALIKERQQGKYRGIPELRPLTESQASLAEDPFRLADMPKMLEAPKNDVWVADQLGTVSRELRPLPMKERMALNHESFMQRRREQLGTDSPSPQLDPIVEIGRPLESVTPAQRAAVPKTKAVADAVPDEISYGWREGENGNAALLTNGQYSGISISPLDNGQYKITRMNPKGGTTERYTTNEETARAQARRWHEDITEGHNPTTRAAAADAEIEQASRIKAVEKADQTLDPDLREAGLSVDNPVPKVGSRGSGTSQRELMMSRRQLRRSTNLSEGDISNVIKTVYPKLAQMHKGGARPTKAMIHKMFVDTLGPEAGHDLFNHIYKASGGAAHPTNMGDWRAAFKEFRQANQPRKRTLETERLVPDGDEGFSYEKYAEEITSSRNPFARALAATTYGALNMFDNPYAKEGRGNFANRALRRRIDAEKRTIKRISDSVKVARMDDEAKRYEARLQSAYGSRGRAVSVASVTDSMNKAVMVGMLFLKPAYLSANLLGQMALAMIDHDLNPTSMYRASKVAHELRKDDQYMRRTLGGAMQDAEMTTLGIDPGVSKTIDRLHTWLANKYGKVLDSPWRHNAFVNEAIRSGHTDADAIRKLLNAPEGSPEFDELVDISRRANKNMIDYGDLNKTERTIIRRILLFYPWIKGSSKYTMRTAFEHPGAALALEQASRQSESGLGLMPSYMEGSFKVGTQNIPGLGNVPEAFNPDAVSVFGSLGDMAELIKGQVTNTGKATDLLAEALTPAVSAGIAAATKRDPFTGAGITDKSALDIFMESLGGRTAPGDLWQSIDKSNRIAEGDLDPRKILFPGPKEDALGKFLGPGFGAIVGRPLGERAVNPTEAAARKQAEDRSTLTRTQAREQKWAGYGKQVTDEAARLGIELPAQFQESLDLLATRDRNIAEWEASTGQKADQFQRLEIDLQELVRTEKMSSEQAKAILGHFTNSRSDDSISRYRTQLGRAYFGRGLVSAYKGYLKRAGADIPDF